MNSNERIASADIPLLLWRGQQVATATGMTVKRIQHLSRTGVLPASRLGVHGFVIQKAICVWVKCELLPKIRTSQ